jgi:hypothetical protein
MREFSNSELNHLTNYWCRTLGIHSKDLVEHPQADDVVLLVNFIKEYEKEFTPKQRIYVYIIWDWCYKQRKPLTRKYLKALEKIIYNIRHIRNLKSKATKKARAKLQAFYHNTEKR